MPTLNHSPKPTDSATDIGYVRRVKAKYEAELMALPHVVGVGIGLAPLTSATTECGLSIVVNVNGVVDRDKLPIELEGVPVTVRDTGEFKAL